MGTEPKPSLHEIAAMPFPASQDAMRKHYDPKWHSEAGDGPCKYRVRADYTISGSLDVVIEADSEDEAEEIAEEMAADEAFSGRVYLDCVRIEPVEDDVQ